MMAHRDSAAIVAAHRDSAAIVAAHRDSAAIVAACRECVGTRFRAQGRQAGLGLDCVGVTLVAARAAGVDVAVPPYRLGGDHERDLDAAIAALGCRPVATPAPGDVLVVAPAPGRRHVAIVTDRGIIHAHAGLDRVVEGPVGASGVFVGAWRLPEKE